MSTPDRRLTRRRYVSKSEHSVPQQRSERRERNANGKIYINAMKSNPLLSYNAFSLLLLVSIAVTASGKFEFCDEEMATLGGVHESRGGAENSTEIDGLGRFAVEEHNKKENALLEFARVVKAEEQVVAGTLHHLTVEVIDAGKKKLYETKVWVKPWLNSKDLQEFKHVGDSPSFTSSDLGVKRDTHGPGWKAVPAHDPQVQDAANHAVQTIQQRSNSLLPYVLQEIVHAKAEVIEDLAKFDMLLKLKRGDKEEKFKVEVHQKNEGTFLLNQMQQDHS